MSAEAHRATGATSTEKLGEHRTRHGELTAEWNALDKSVKDARIRIDTLKITSGDSSHGNCFSCLQDLSHEDAIALIASQERDIAAAEISKAEVKKLGEVETEAIATLTALIAACARDAAAADRASSEAEAQVARTESLIATGEPDFDTPEHIKQAAYAAIAAGATKYTPTPAARPEYPVSQRGFFTGKP